MIMHDAEITLASEDPLWVRSRHQFLSEPIDPKPQGNRRSDIAAPFGRTAEQDTSSGTTWRSAA
jgi:hypothetical protein